MTNYLCSVSGKFPENYDIGVQANRWGVEEKYEDRIKEVKPGDLLVFVVGGEFRSIHEVESAPFSEETPLWPPKDNSLFPHRIRIGDPMMKGQVPLRIIAEQISFMKGKVYSGTIQGRSGVFNERLTDSDIETIKQHMTVVTQESKQAPAPDKDKTIERQTALFKFYEKDIEDHISQILPQMGLNLYQDPITGKTGRQYQTNVGRLDLLCTDTSGRLIIVELKKGEAPEQTLLQVLRYMSWIRQNLAKTRDVQGIILTEAADKSLVEIVKEVHNVEIKYYRLTIELI